MNSRKRKLTLTQEEINAILFASSDESDLESEDDGWPSNIEDRTGNESLFIEDEEDESSDESEEENSGENETKENDINFSWSSSINNDAINTQLFSKAGGGPKHNLEVGSTPLQYFRLLMTDEICKEICENTNKYANFNQHSKQKKSKNVSWKPFTGINEFLRFIAILLIMGISKLPRIKDYWSLNPILGNEKVKRTMSRDRFLLIYKFLHLSDRENELPANHPEYYLMQKLDPFMTDLKKSFQKHFEPYHHISIDEAMIKYKGRLGIIQYMPLKPTKRGIKIWMQCTSYFGYINNFEVYCGKKDKLPRSSHGLGYSVVTHLSKSLKGHHHLYFDRFFTNVILMRDLLRSGHYASGTVMKNRKHLPSEISKSKLTVNGTSKSFQCVEENNLLVFGWCDKKELYLLSTGCKDEITTVKRRIGGEVNSIPCPLAISNYNSQMGGVDLSDQNRKYYDISRKSRKWWHYIFWFLINNAVNNAFIIYCTSNFPLEKKPKSLLDFKLTLIDELIDEDFRPSEEKGISLSHKRIKINGRKKTCFLCRKNNIKTITNRQIESSWKCEKCDVCLCIGCFGPYHNNVA